PQETHACGGMNFSPPGLAFCELRETGTLPRLGIAAQQQRQMGTDDRPVQRRSTSVHAHRGVGEPVACSCPTVKPGTSFGDCRPPSVVDLKLREETEPRRTEPAGCEEAREHLRDHHPTCP